MQLKLEGCIDDEPLKAPDYLGGGLPTHWSALWCQFTKTYMYILFNFNVDL